MSRYILELFNRLSCSMSVNEVDQVHMLAAEHLIGTSMITAHAVEFLR